MEDGARTDYGTALGESNVAIGDDRRFSQWVNVPQFFWCKHFWGTLVQLDLIGNVKLFLEVYQ
jgi:hypothetical protein